MRGYETRHDLENFITRKGYESPCGVMSPRAQVVRTAPFLLRIPMRGYETYGFLGAGVNERCYESPCGVMS